MVQVMKTKTLKPKSEENFYLSINEFTDNSAQLGFFHNEAKPYNFFTIEDTTDSGGNYRSKALISSRLQLSDKRYLY